MKPDIQRAIENTEFRVFIDFDESYRSYIAHCPDTGAVATAETPEEAESLVTRILENDFRIAIEQQSLESLFLGRGQAAFEVSSGAKKREVKSEHGAKLFIVARKEHLRSDPVLKSLHVHLVTRLASAAGVPCCSVPRDGRITEFFVGNLRATVHLSPDLEYFSPQSILRILVIDHAERPTEN